MCFITLEDIVVTKVDNVTADVTEGSKMVLLSWIAPESNGWYLSPDFYVVQWGPPIDSPVFVPVLVEEDRTIVEEVGGRVPNFFTKAFMSGNKYS